MQLEEKLSELNLTEEELGKFTKAFKDENFRKMLREYAEEISDPENRKKYEEEIAILEKERGNSVKFLHPTPFKCIRTSINGKNKCYVNVCANDEIGKPLCKRGLSEDGKSGHNWSLPHSLHPERKELDPKGNKILIYDAIFHPDTLHMATTNNRFMDMVTTVALQSIEDGFHVRLDKNNIKTMSTKYKGTPQACVIRKAIPGFEAKDATDDADPLAFPYPDSKATVSEKEQPTNSPSHSKQLANTQLSTKPHYTLKYQSLIDIQDFTCSRESTKSSRPKQIILTIDLPLLKSVATLTLEVKEKSLLLESQNPAYKLELSLSYAVDEDRGTAKFNKQTRQLLVTLPIRPPKDGLLIHSSPQESANDLQDSEGVSERGSEEEKDDTGDICDREEEGAGVSQQQESNVKLCEEPQDGTEREEHMRVTNEENQVTTQEVQTCEKKEEGEAIHETQDGKELETELESKAQIRDDFIKTEKTSEDVPGDSEDVTGDSEDVTGDSEDVTGDSEDVPGGSEHVTGDSEDVTGDSEDVPGDSEDVTGDSEDVPGGSEHVPGDSEDVTGDSEDVTGDSEDVTGDSEDVTGDSEDVTGDSEDVPGDSEDVTGDSEDVPGDSEDVPGDSEDVPGDSEDVPGDSEHVPGDSEHVPGDSEDVTGDSEDVPRDSEHVPGDSEDVTGDSEDVPGDSEDVTGDSEDVPRDSEDVTGDSEDVPRDSEPVTAAVEVDEDLLKSQRAFEKASFPPLLLREVREDGSERVISDHVTTAGFSFHNSLLFELD